MSLIGSARGEIPMEILGDKPFLYAVQPNAVKK